MKIHHETILPLPEPFYELLERQLAALNNPSLNIVTLNYRDPELPLRQMLSDGFNTPTEVARPQAVVTSRAYRPLGTSESLALRTAEATSMC